MLLFQEEGIFFVQPVLKKLPFLQDQTDMILLGRKDQSAESGEEGEN